MNIAQSTTLYFKDGASDKQYTATLLGATVTFAWGRRGSTLQTDTKTLATDTAARNLYEKKLAEKVAKGYTPGDDAPAMAAPARSDRRTDLPKPMLLNAITRDEVEVLLDSNEWLMQEKADGVRAIVRLNHTTDSAETASRTGLPVALTNEIVSELLKIFVCDAILDTEVCGDRIVLLDILEHNSKDLCDMPCETRASFLKTILDERMQVAGKCSSVFFIASFSNDKRVAMRLLREAGAEGIVFKKRKSPYSAGRPNSGGPGLKFKFTASASVIVIGPNKDGKRSVDIAVRDSTKLVPIGSVSVPAKHGELPISGTIIEVEYLYVLRGGSLIQPVFKCVRTDVRCPDDVKTLQYKGEAR